MAWSPWRAEGIPSSRCHVSSRQLVLPRCQPLWGASEATTQNPSLTRDNSLCLSRHPPKKPKGKAEPFTVRPRGFGWRFLVVLAQPRARRPSPSAAAPPGLPAPVLPRWLSPAWSSPAGWFARDAVTKAPQSRRLHHRKALLTLEARSPRSRCRRSFLLRPEGEPAPPSPGSGVGLCWLLEPSPDLPLHPHVAFLPVCVSVSTCSTVTSS